MHWTLYSSHNPSYSEVKEVLLIYLLFNFLIVPASRSFVSSLAAWGFQRFMRYLSISKLFNVSSPSLPFRQSSKCTTIPNDEVAQGPRPNGVSRAGKFGEVSNLPR